MAKRYTSGGRDKPFLPRIGIRTRRITDDGEINVYASSYSFTPERIEFSETDENKRSSFYFILEKLGDNKTRLTIDFYLKKNTADELLFKLFRKRKMRKDLEQSLSNLDKVVKEIRLPDDPSSN